MEDIFKELGITDSDGNNLSETNINPCMGCQIVHKQTRRILPQCQRFEIMGYDFAMKKLNAIIGFYRSIEEYFNPEDYEFEPIYLNEIEEMKSGFILLYTDTDKKNMKLFN